MATNNADNFSKPTKVPNGGTGISSTTAYAPIIGGTTSTGSLQQATSNFGSSGTILVSNGTSPSWVGTQGMTLITTLTASASASLAFTSSNITSSYTSYLIKLANITDSSASAPTFSMSFSTNNGSTYLATGYKTGYISNNYNSNGRATTFSNITGILLPAEVNANRSTNGEIFINLPQSGIASYIGLGFVNASTTPVNLMWYGVNSGTTFINNIKFAYSVGNITAGTISLYGISQ